MHQQPIDRLIIFLLIFPLSVNAQVLVKDEPRHQPVFENAFVRVLDVRIKPGDTTLYHIHQLPSAFLMLSDTRVGSQLFNDLPTEGFNNTGTVAYEQFNQPRVHRVWNMDTALFHVVDIEILTAETTTETAILQMPGLTLVQDEKKARIYRVQLAPAREFQFSELNNPVLFFSVTGTITHPTEGTIGPGRFLFIDKGKSATLYNNGAVEMSGAVFEIK